MHALIPIVVLFVLVGIAFFFIHNHHKAIAAVTAPKAPAPGGGSTNGAKPVETK